MIPARVVRIVLIDNARAARGGQPVPGDLGRACVRHGDDDQFLTDGPAPHPGTDVPRRRRVAHRPHPDRLIVVDQTLVTQSGGVRLGRQHVQMTAFDREPVDRRRTGLAMHPGVDVLAPLLAGGDQLGEGAVLPA
jgi:hypothetical protein